MASRASGERRVGNAAEFEAALRGPDAYRVARKAMDAMVQHKVWPTPPNYELWLYWAGNPASPLAAEIDRMIAAGQAFTDGACEALTGRFLPRLALSDSLRDAGD